MNAEQIFEQLQEVAESNRDLLMPTQEQVKELHAKAEARGCGLAVVDGMPGTLTICDGTVMGELLVLDRKSVGGGW